MHLFLELYISLYNDGGCMNNIVIVSDGTEIAYAKTLSDLFVIRTEDQDFFSSYGKECNVELYSKQTFLHSSVSKKALKIIIGNTTIDTPQMSAKYDKNGLHCFVGDHYARLCIDEKKALSNYELIYKELKELEKRYFEQEKEFVSLVNRKETQLAQNSKSIFSKNKSNELIVQAYLCLAYYYYLNEIS